MLPSTIYWAGISRITRLIRQYGGVNRFACASVSINSSSVYGRYLPSFHNSYELRPLDQHARIDFQLIGAQCHVRP